MEREAGDGLEVTAVKKNGRRSQAADGENGSRAARRGYRIGIRGERGGNIAFALCGRVGGAEEAVSEEG